MSADFEWRFGDELPEEASEGGQPQLQPWRRWLIWLVLVLLCASGCYAWWRLRQRTLSQTEARVEQVARLELDARAEGDTELLLSLQDSADKAWRDAQLTYTGAAALPLPIQALTATETTVETARIVGDRALVEIEHSAVLSSGRRATFRAVRFYGLAGRGRWVHTKADLDDGGRPVSLAEGPLEVSVREVDAEWVEPMVPDMAALVSDYCDLTSCQLELPLTLDLGATLIEAANPEDITLPAPYLVGAPQGEAAEAAWEAALQRFLLDHLISREIGSRPPGVHAGEIFQDRLRAWFRVQFGLERAVSPDLELIAEALETEAWIPLWELWDLDPDHPRRPLAKAETDLLLAFIQREDGTSAVARLPQAFRDAYHPGDAIVDVVGEPWWRFRSRYLAYVRQVTAWRSGELAGFPSYDLMVSCWESLGSTRLREVWGLRLCEPELTLLSVGPGTEDLLPISWSPDGGQLLVVQEEDAGLEFYLLRTHRSEPQVLATMPSDVDLVGSPRVGETGWSPDGAYLAYRAPGRFAEGGIVDLESGDHRAFEGNFVAWSPDSTRLMHAQPVAWHWSPELRVQTFWVRERDADRSRRLGQAYAAAWSPDGARIVYVTPEPSLRTYDTTTSEIATLLDKASLREMLSFTPTLSPISGQPFEIAWSATGEWIALAATRTREPGTEETLTMLVRDGAHRVLGRRAGGLLGLSWSPDGRWLTTFTFDRAAFNSIVSDPQGETLFDGDGTSVSWSHGGRYMAVVRDRPSLLGILEIESREWQRFDVSGDCWSAVWNPRAPLDGPAERSIDLVPGPDWRSSIQECDLPHCRP